LETGDKRGYEQWLVHTPKELYKLGLI
jgi:hypothetical protein